MQSIDLIETFTYGTIKNLATEKVEIEYNNIVKLYKNDKLWWCYKRKHRRA